MITRRSDVRGVGSLKNMRTEKAGEYDFGQRTVMLAPNATGQTTLAAVLKSYGAENPTAEKTVEQKVERNRTPHGG